jgi:hypothetical protein
MFNLPQYQVTRNKMLLAIANLIHVEITVAYSAVVEDNEQIRECSLIFKE